MLIVETQNKEAIKTNAVYSLCEVCNLLGLTRQSILNLRKSGELIPFMLGKSIRFSGKSLLNLMKKLPENRKVLAKTPGKQYK